MRVMAWKPLAAGLAIIAGLVALAAAGWLMVDAFAARRDLPRDEARVEELLEKGETDPAFAEVLHEEFDRQTAVSLERDRRVVVLGWVLLVAGGVFVLSARWLLVLRRRVPAAPGRVLAACVRAGHELEVPETDSVGLPVVESVDLSPVDEIVARLGGEAAAAIPILLAIQGHYRYLPDAALARVCELTEITAGQLAGVASFYTSFRRTPRGEHVVTVCHGTACHVAGAPRISDELRRQLGIGAGEDTDAERKFTVQPVPCLGCCTLAPVVQVDEVTHGHVRPDTAVELARAAGEDLMVPTPRFSPPPFRCAHGWGTLPASIGPPVGEIRLGMGSCCVANGSGHVHDALYEALSRAGVHAVVKQVGCVGMCHQTPFVEVAGDGGSGVLYSQVGPGLAGEIVRRHFKPAGLVDRLRRVAVDVGGVLKGAAERPVVAAGGRIELRDPPVAAFLGRQKHIATEHYGELDPLDLDEYLAREGFAALELCRELAPERIIDRVARSGLRGRGGAGFPTGRKWAAVRRFALDAANSPCVICNGDEGDPGAFMDRMLMESYPYRVIEGLAIAARAVGAREGVFYIRAEYLLAVERIEEALRRCEERGLLVDGPRLRVARGAGAFVCGEETALIASLEGQRGMPTLRPPYPAERGLHGRPTLVNNVETYALVPWIMRHGPEAFAALGTPTSTGTKVFALTGKVARGGLIEVPMGITVREIVETIGGGIKAEELEFGSRPRSFKAVQIGGPSGGCVPERLADTPVDYEALEEVGAIMGSGGLVVLDDTDCMVDIARYFLSFTQSQSCGKCTPGRIGTQRMLEIMDRLCAGTGRPDDLEKLEHLAGVVEQTSLCGLGKTAPNPVLTTLRYFREEYEAHLAGRCPASKCKGLIEYSVTDACTGCTLCAQHCPVGAIRPRPYERHEIDSDICTRCDMCRVWCPEDAIRIE